MPSPAIATIAPCACSCRDDARLVAGRAPRRGSRRARAAAATASAVVRLSPVSMTTRSPSRRSAAMASAVVRLDRIGDAEHGRPARPSTATSIAVCPAARSRPARRLERRRRRRRRRRARRCRPPPCGRRSRRPTPWPVTERNCSTGNSGRPRSAARRRQSRSPADARSAARGWPRAAGARSRRRPPAPRRRRASACPR